MKKIIVIIAAGTLLAACSRMNKNRYTITDSRGIEYGANFYNKTEDGCIQFNDIGCGCGEMSEGSGEPTRICGSYTITENITK
jgi:major membrane immunogen (membrane-anchored lipoprotein)